MVRRSVAAFGQFCQVDLMLRGCIRQAVSRSFGSGKLEESVKRLKDDVTIERAARDYQVVATWVAALFKGVQHSNPQQHMLTDHYGEGFVDISEFGPSMGSRCFADLCRRVDHSAQELIGMEHPGCLICQLGRLPRRPRRAARTDGRKCCPKCWLGYRSRRPGDQVKVVLQHIRIGHSLTFQPAPAGMSR